MAIPLNLPFRQHDPEWADEVMWDRRSVIAAATGPGRMTRPTAEALLREFRDGNTIANEGCQLTCLAMVLRLLARRAPSKWTPARLNRQAHLRYFYTPAALSLVQLYADLVLDITDGEVQLCAKEEYLGGSRGWLPTYASGAWIIRSYRRLTPRARRDFVVMLKTGTHDDSVASHYVLLHPDRPGINEEENPEILDPAMPLYSQKEWRLSDSAKQVTRDPEIAREWRKAKIKPLQLSGVFLFGRWRRADDDALMRPMLEAWSGMLAGGRPRAV